MSVKYSKGVVTIDQTSSSGSSFPSANLAWRVIDPVNGIAPSLLNLNLTYSAGAYSIQVVTASGVSSLSARTWTLHYYSFAFGTTAPGSPTTTDVVVTPTEGAPAYTIPGVQAGLQFCVYLTDSLGNTYPAATISTVF